MSYKKKTSTEIEKGRRRLSGIEAIDHNLDMGNGLSRQSYSDKIERASQSLSLYNSLLSQADAALSHFEEEEKQLASMSERMLASVGVVYGYDSIEYEQAGGTRKSDVKRSSAKQKVTE